LAGGTIRAADGREVVIPPGATFVPAAAPPAAVPMDAEPPAPAAAKTNSARLRDADAEAAAARAAAARAARTRDGAAAEVVKAKEVLARRQAALAEAEAAFKAAATDAREKSGRYTALAAQLVQEQELEKQAAAAEAVATSQREAARVARSSPGFDEAMRQLEADLGPHLGPGGGVLPGPVRDILAGHLSGFSALVRAAEAAASPAATSPPAGAVETKALPDGSPGPVILPPGVSGASPAPAPSGAAANDTPAGAPLGANPDRERTPRRGGDDDPASPEASSGASSGGRDCRGRDRRGQRWRQRRALAPPGVAAPRPPGLPGAPPGTTLAALALAAGPLCPPSRWLAPGWRGGAAAAGVLACIGGGRSGVAVAAPPPRRWETGFAW